MEGSQPIARKAALVQLEAVHEEVLPSLCAALMANGVEPVLFLNERIRDNRGDLFSLVDAGRYAVHYRPLASRADWQELEDEITAIDELDVVVMTTFQSDGNAQFAERLGKPVIGVVHNPVLFCRSEDCVGLLARRQVTPVSLAPHVTRWMQRHHPATFREVATISVAHCGPVSPETGPEAFAGVRRLVIPGAVNFSNRDYAPALDALDVLAETDPAVYERLELVIVGGGDDRPALEQLVSSRGHAPRVRLTPLGPAGAVPHDAYLEELHDASFALPCLAAMPPHTEGFRGYRTFKISGALSASLAFALPAVTDHWTALVYDLPCVAHAPDGLPRALRTAATMSHAEYVALRSRLVELRSARLCAAIPEMADALQRAMTPAKELR